MKILAPKVKVALNQNKIAAHKSFGLCREERRDRSEDTAVFATLSRQSVSSGSIEATGARVSVSALI